MTKIGLIVNRSTKAAEIDSGKICEYITKKGGSAYLCENDIPKDLDFMLAFGGDGTIIQAARKIAPLRIPILGVNLGTVGFLAEVEMENVYRSIDALFEKNFHIEKRFMLRGKVIKEGRPAYEGDALNDIAVARGGLVRAISLSVSINENLMKSFYGDGVVVTTPTGSTGYSLSAGGQVMMADVEAFGILPICPHSLDTRGVIASSSSKVTIDVEWSKKSDPSEALVSFDGNRGIELMPGDEVIIVKSDMEVSFLRIKEFDFFDNLRKKFY